MIDPELERALNDNRQLLTLWEQFNLFFTAAVKGEGLTHERELQFLELKSKIAMLHDSLMGQVGEERGYAAMAQNMLENVIRAISLKHINKMGPADIKKMEIEWHETYLLVNEIIGNLEEKEAATAKISKTHWQWMQLQKKLLRTGGDIVHNNNLKLALIAAAVIFALVGLPMMGVFSYGALRDIGPLQKPVFMAIETVVRPYINKNVAWRSINEAFDFGRKSSQYPEDYQVMQISQAARMPMDAASAAKWIAETARQSQFPPGEALAKAQEYRIERFRVAGSDDFVLMYFLMPTVPEAFQASDQINQWKAGLPPQVRPAIESQMEVFCDYNLLVVAFCKNKSNIEFVKNTIWDIAKVKR